MPTCRAQAAGAKRCESIVTRDSSPHLPPAAATASRRPSHHLRLKVPGWLDNLYLDVSPASARGILKFPHTTAAVAALLAICGCFTLGAIGAFPLWDDGWIWLLLREKGRWAIQTSFSDRPLNAWLWTTLAVREGLLWNTALVAQAVLWPAMGWVSARLWNRLFPNLKRYAWLAACVSVAPFVTKIQMVTLNIALASLLPVILARRSVEE